jgi:hypothetical protein
MAFRHVRQLPTSDRRHQPPRDSRVLGDANDYRGLDFAMLTRIFGDSVSVTWERYLKVDKSRQISQWTRDLAEAIGEGTDESDGLVNSAD